ncbi:MAG: hypothetical protein A07HR60_01534 [uncultured archaeon A07HR60]|jgi:hypothetical protein|nr:MAG: hypothetical protein J07HR59_01656 [Halorubrum sp. J07HR59]ESS11478.1 MAG: hypothetical protein A07HR60_01534 [uncultured archaeon A07HR60]
MSDDDSDEEEPAVELGDGPDVDGAPVARVAARLTWPAPQSDILNQEGDAVIRTPNGPQELSAVLEAADVEYYDTRDAFLEAVNSVTQSGPIETA